MKGEHIMDMINNRRDLRLYWEILTELTEMVKEMGSNEKRNEHIIRIKKGIRDYYKRQEAEKKVTYLNIDDYGYYTMLYALDVPSDWSEEDVREWFEENEFHHYQYREYDCTGQHFTRRFKVFKRNGQWMTYHHMAIDC